MPKGGRPSKLNPQVKQRLIEALEAGNCLEPACAYAGVDYSTFRKWMQRGEKEGKGEFFEFFEDINRAIANAEVSLVSKIKQDKDWKAAAWILERRHSERWSSSQKIKIEVEKQMEAAVDVLKEKLSPDVYNQVLEAWANVDNGET